MVYERSAVETRKGWFFAALDCAIETDRFDDCADRFRKPHAVPSSVRTADSGQGSFRTGG